MSGNSRFPCQIRESACPTLGQTACSSRSLPPSCRASDWVLPYVVRLLPHTEDGCGAKTSLREARRSICCFPPTVRMRNTTPFVAIVDDEEPIRRAMTRLCQAYELDVATFASAQQLFDLLDGDGRHPDCLVLDIHMPGIGGLETR